MQSLSTAHSSLGGVIGPPPVPVDPPPLLGHTLPLQSKLSNLYEETRARRAAITNYFIFIIFY